MVKPRRKKELVDVQSFITEQSRLNDAQARLSKALLDYIKRNDEKMEIMKVHVQNLEWVISSIQPFKENDGGGGGYMYS